MTEPNGITVIQRDASGRRYI